MPLHPDFPIVRGLVQLTEEWSILLDQAHNKRIEKESLVLWRPGFTVWINVWGNNHGESVESRLQWITEEASKDVYDSRSESKGDVHVFAYRLDEIGEGESVLSYYGYVIAPSGHLQIGIYFDLESDLETAKGVVDSVQYHAPSPQ